LVPYTDKLRSPNMSAALWIIRGFALESSVSPVEAKLISVIRPPQERQNKMELFQRKLSATRPADAGLFATT